MYSEKFLKLTKGYQSKLENLKNSNIEEYILEMNNFSSNMEMVLPEDMNKFLETTGIKEDFQLWKESSLSMLKSLDEYGVDVEKRVIFVRKGDDRIETPLLDVNKYVESKVAEEDSWQRVLALSFMMRPENYEYYQITNSLIMQDS